MEGVHRQDGGVVMWDMVGWVGRDGGGMVCWYGVTQEV